LGNLRSPAGQKGFFLTHGCGLAHDRASQIIAVVLRICGRTVQ
jgi:hypothetical protein